MIEDLKTEISGLSVRDKIELLNCLYHDLSGHGTDGDTELAHINIQEAAILKALGGSGTVNEITGLRQYGKGGGSPAPAPSSTSTTQEIPEELKPYITDILSKSQAIQEKRTAEGYRPYQGQSLADFTPEQQRAMQGISGLVGTSQQYLDPAARLTAASAMTPTGAEVSQYMSPYMQQVVDIQQREARRAADVSGQELAAQAVGRGAFGGSRQAILEAEAGRNLQTQLGDIQARGLAGAYEDAQRRLTEQRQRQLAGGAQFAQMAPTAVSTGLQELGALQQAGGMRQAQSQAALDIARQQFEAEKAFPEQTLQQYSSIIRGYAAPIGPSTQTSTLTAAPTYLQQLAGLGSIGTGLYAASKFKEGGQVGDGKGIASIIVKREHGGKVVKLQEGGMPTNYSSLSPPELFDLLRRGEIDGPTLNSIFISQGLDPITEAKKNNARLNPQPSDTPASSSFGQKLFDTFIRSRGYDPAAAAPAAAAAGKLPFDIDKVLATTTAAPAPAPAAAAAPAPALPSNNPTLNKGQNLLNLTYPEILGRSLEAGEKYQAGVAEGLQAMREGAKTDKELAGLNFIQQSLAALANTTPGAKLGEMVAQASPTISQATTAALKANKEAQAELRAAEMGEKKLGYDIAKEQSSTLISLKKELAKTGLTTAEKTNLFKVISDNFYDPKALEDAANAYRADGTKAGRDAYDFINDFLNSKKERGDPPSREGDKRGVTTDASRPLTLRVNN